MSMTRANATSSAFKDIAKNKLKTGDIFYTVRKGSSAATECWVVKRIVPPQMWASRIRGTTSRRTQMHCSSFDPGLQIEYIHMDWTPDSECLDPEAEEVLFDDGLCVGGFYKVPSDDLWRSLGCQEQHLRIVRIEGLPGNAWPSFSVDV